MGTTATFTSRKSRFLAGLPAELHLDDRDLPVRAFDLSRSGVLITGEFDPPTKEWVRITLRSVNGDLELTVTARVARVVTDLDEQQRGIGLELPRLDAAACRTLDALVARVLEGMVPAEQLPTAKSVAWARDYLKQDRQAGMDALAEAGEEGLANTLVAAPWEPENERPLGYQCLQMMAHLNIHKAQLFYYLKLMGRDVNTLNLWGM